MFEARLENFEVRCDTLSVRQVKYEDVLLPTGPVDPAKTSFPDHPQWLVVTAGTYHSMTVVPRDAYGNAATIQQDHLTVNIRKVRREGGSLDLVKQFFSPRKILICMFSLEIPSL